jgi:hypothetical protein
MHAMGAGAGGQVGSLMAAAVMLSDLKGMGVIKGGALWILEALDISSLPGPLYRLS